nr:hypothetical protein [Mycoplasmopsis bovis]
MINLSTYTSLENVKKCFYDENKFFIPAEQKEQIVNDAIKYALNKELLLIKENKVYTTQTYNDEMTIASIFS